MSKLLTILLLPVISTCAEEWAFVGNPLYAVRPCNDTEDVFIQYEPGKPPEDENEYNLRITKEFPVQTRMNLKFDSPVSVSLVSIFIYLHLFAQ